MIYEIPSQSVRLLNMTFTALIQEVLRVPDQGRDTTAMAVNVFEIGLVSSQIFPFKKAAVNAP